MKINSLTPESTILDEYGTRLSQIRKQHGHSQIQLASLAGIGVATLRRIEDGKDSQLSSWLKILKALDMTAAIDALLPETFQSPMAEVRETQKKRRARNSPDKDHIWGDETP